MSGAIALVVAAGRGSRFGAEVPKQYAPLGGRPLLRHSLDAFARHPRIDAVTAVIHPDDEAQYAAAAGGLDLPAPAPGGATRQESVLRGLERLEPLAPDVVLIHDGARPFVGAAVIDRVLDALATSAGAIAALPVTDTLKRGADARITETVPRAGLWRAQTPQGFRFAEILRAHRGAAGAELTDDAAVAEHAGLDVALVGGATENIKVTTPEDLARAERWLAGANTGPLDAPAREAAYLTTKVGIGQDSHEFETDRPKPLVLGGVEIPGEPGLRGNSDADVVLHALCNAISSVTGELIIGERSDRMCRELGITDSAAYVVEALRTLKSQRIVHVAIAIEGRRPRLAKHLPSLRERVAAMLGLQSSQVGATVTSGEGLTAFGRGEGIQALVTISVEDYGGEASLIKARTTG